MFSVSIIPEISGSPFTDEVMLFESIWDHLYWVLICLSIRKIISDICWCSTLARKQSNYHASKQQKQQGCKLYQQLHVRSCIVLLSVPPIEMLLLRSPNIGPAVHTVIKKSSTEEHTKQVIRVEVILMKLWTITLLKVFFCTMLIIKFPFFWVAQTGKSLTNFLKGICCLRSLVLVRMKLQC